MNTDHPCDVAGCDRMRYRAKPWCVNHSRRARLYGDPLKVAPRRPPRAKPKCAVEECEKESDAKGYCGPHYHRFTRYGDPLLSGHTRGACSVEGCDRQHYAKGLCQMHWNRQHRHGDVGVAGYIRPPYEAICQVEGCEEPHTSKGYCNTHYRRQLKRGSLDLPPVQYRYGPDHPQWKERPSYHSAHRRVDRDRGLAATFSCVACGETALQWSYDHSDPDELVSQTGNSKGCLYSADVTRYEPKCRSCHAAADAAHRRAAGVKYGDRRKSVA